MGGVGEGDDVGGLGGEKGRWKKMELGWKFTILMNRYLGVIK